MNNYENYENHENTEHEAGQLLINQNAIHDSGTNHDNINSIGHEIAPFLFLENMTQIEEHRVTENAQILANTREQIFITETQPGGFDPNDFVATLFQDEETRTSTNIGTNNQVTYFNIPMWVIIIGIITATTLLTFVAITLGKRMAGVIHKQKPEEQ